MQRDLLRDQAPRKVRLVSDVRITPSRVAGWLVFGAYCAAFLGVMWWVPSPFWISYWAALLAAPLWCLFVTLPWLKNPPAQAIAGASILPAAWLSVAAWGFYGLPLFSPDAAPWIAASSCP